jgi:hypothetical protein
LYQLDKDDPYVVNPRTTFFHAKTSCLTALGTAELATLLSAKVGYMVGFLRKDTAIPSFSTLNVATTAKSDMKGLNQKQQHANAMKPLTT